MNSVKSRYNRQNENEIRKWDTFREAIEIIPKQNRKKESMVDWNETKTLCQDTAQNIGHIYHIGKLRRNTDRPKSYDSAKIVQK